ncbi:MAG: hypothetical protein GQ523_03995 [Methanophagales archaeon]|nr:hypothetical protein [Methanophagales archaeon]
MEYRSGICKFSSGNHYPLHPALSRLNETSITLGSMMAMLAGLAPSRTTLPMTPT